MRFVQLILAAVLAAVAVFAGLFAALLVATGALVAFIARRFVGRPRALSPTAAPAPARRSAAPVGEAIDITATEVHPEPPAR